MRQEKEYIIFCDESDKEGKYYSTFYGGLIVGASHYERVTAHLNTIKQEQNLYGEVKWEKATQRYLQKYEILMKHFFQEIASKNIKVRIMFQQNAYKPKKLSNEQIEMQYFLLYYQFIKHGFGLEFMESTDVGTKIRLYFDQFPDTQEKIEQFKGFLHALQKNRKFQNSNIIIANEDIVEVKSHNHVLLQCLDIVLGL